MLLVSLFFLVPFVVFFKKNEATRRNVDSLYLVDFTNTIFIGGCGGGGGGDESELLDSPKLELSSSVLVANSSSTPFRTVFGDFFSSNELSFKVDACNGSLFGSCPIEMIEHPFGACFMQYFVISPFGLFQFVVIVRVYNIFRSINY